MNTELTFSDKDFDLLRLMFLTKAIVTENFIMLTTYFFIHFCGILNLQNKRSDFIACHFTIGGSSSSKN